MLQALKNVLSANGDIKDIASKSWISRQAIYTMLSEDGNPTLKKFFSFTSYSWCKN